MYKETVSQHEDTVSPHEGTVSLLEGQRFEIKVNKIMQVVNQKQNN